MRYFFLAIFFFLSQFLFSQAPNQIGELKLSEATVIKIDTVLDNICGYTIKVIHLTILAKTKVQLSCNYGNPSKSMYDTVQNKVYISYAYDTTGIVHDSIINEIKQFVTEKAAGTKQYENSNDFRYFFLVKSFYVNDEKTIIPFIWTGAENSGDYQMFYLNKQVYKIILADVNGLGCLSEFVDQNMFFTKNGQRIKLGKYTENINVIKQTAAKEWVLNK